MKRLLQKPRQPSIVPWKPVSLMALLQVPLALGMTLLPAPVLAADEHAGHVMPAPEPGPVAEESHAPQAAPSPLARRPDPHAGHHMPAPLAPAPDPHSGHVQGAQSARGDSRFPPPTPEEVAAAFPTLEPHAHMAGDSWTLVLLDRLEAQDRDAGTALAWDGLLSWGDAFDRGVLSSEGEQLNGEDAELRHELYWQHAVAPWWESRLGLRHDDGEGPARDWLGIGLQGLAPQFVELSAMAYLGESGRSAFTLVAAYDARLTNRLILQPRLELNAYGEEDVGSGIGSGLADSEVGLRLRYEIRREIAPYAGVEWRRLYGDTADLARAAATRTGEARAVAGLRVWF